MKRTAVLGIGIAVLLGAAGLNSRTQAQTSSNTQASSGGPSLGDYARQVRKEPDGKPKPKVFDNDNLPKSEKLSVVGKATEPAPDASTDQKPEETPKTAPAAGSEAKPQTANPPADTSKLDQ